MSSTDPEDRPDPSLPAPDRRGDEPAPGRTPSPEEGSADEQALGEEDTYRMADVVDPSTVRHAPRYGRFIVVGILLGALVSLLLTVLPLGSSGLSAANLIGLLFLSFGTLGALLGAVVALVVDRRSLRRLQARMAAGRGDGPSPDSGSSR